MSEEMPIKRINELANKAKTIGLTPEEKDEQAELRKKYLELFRKGMRQQLESITIVDEKGNTKKLSSKEKRN